MARKCNDAKKILSGRLVPCNGVLIEFFSKRFKMFSFIIYIIFDVFIISKN